MRRLIPLLLLGCGGKDDPPAGATDTDTHTDATAPDTDPADTDRPGDTDTDPPGDTDTDLPGDTDTTDTAAPARDRVELPGADFFPEGIAAAADGTLYVGSIATGAIAVAGPGEDAATVVVPAGTFGLNGVMGLEVDAAGDLLWFCTADLDGVGISTLEAYQLGAMTPVHSFPLPADGFCNEVEVTPDGTVYATDSFGGKIWRVTSARDALEVWMSDPFFVNPGRIALNGLAADDDVVYSARFDLGRLFRFGVAGDGAPEPTVHVELDADVGTPDGLEWDGADLLLVDGKGNRLLRVALSGDQGHVTAVPANLRSPTTTAVHGRDAWVVEGQLEFLDQGAPTLPFTVVRVPLVP